MDVIDRKMRELDNTRMRVKELRHDLKVLYRLSSEADLNVNSRQQEEIAFSGHRSDSVNNHHASR